MCRRGTPPSRNLSEGGVGGDALTKETLPPSHVSSEGGGGSSNTTKRKSLRRVAKLLLLLPVGSQ